MSAAKYDFEAKLWSRSSSSTTAPAPAAVGAVDANESNSAQFSVTSPAESGVETIATISGPGTGGTFASGPTVYVDGGGVGYARNLLPASSYTVTLVRHRFYDVNTGKVANLTSAPVSFTFTTLTLQQSRPSTPSIAVTSSTTTHVVVNWAPSVDNTSTETQLSYTYAVAGDVARQAVPTCFQYCFGATGTQISRPPAGTSIRVTVTAQDYAGVRSLLSNEIVIVG